MCDLVTLTAKRNRGWPWPDDSWGLSPMFGPDGWCLGCGRPLREQLGSLVLRRRGFSRVAGAWIPNWQFNAMCVEQSIGDELARRFDVRLRPVAWHGQAPGDAVQLVVPTVGESWFDQEELRSRTSAHHGVAGATCPECGNWRWMPVPLLSLPPVHVGPELASVDIGASPECFGDGWNSFDQIVMRREMAELIAVASPADVLVEDVPLVDDNEYDASA